MKESNNVVFLDKTYYSAFAFTKLNQLLSKRSINTTVLAGLLTDICVLHTAIDAYERGYNIEVVESAVASLTDLQNEFLINHMKNVLGARIIKK
ncbi:isochorismatase family cysteine hydrolase [Helcococcus bovis]|uniref:cysteine hydrolase family protein n=1 Tax=Helcococcus bovis TaxID=3153252 RepID=UPI0038B9C187